jgi:hypothetical protein
MLIGHLVGTGVIFAFLLGIAWLTSWFLSFLNGIHPFSDDIYHLAAQVELWGFYADILLCGVVVLAGIYRFCIDVFTR